MLAPLDAQRIPKTEILRLCDCKALPFCSTPLINGLRHAESLNSGSSTPLVPRCPGAAGRRAAGETNAPRAALAAAAARGNRGAAVRGRRAGRVAHGVGAAHEGRARYIEGLPCLLSLMFSEISDPQSG